MGQRWRQHPPLNQVSFPEARRIAEDVRSAWTRGGPRMARTEEIMVPAPDGPVRVRILDPLDDGLRPAFVYLHGGGWTLFSIDTHDRLMREYAARSGMMVIAVDYSLSPEVRFPRAINETSGRHAHDRSAGVPDPRRCSRSAAGILGRARLRCDVRRSHADGGEATSRGRQVTCRRVCGRHAQLPGSGFDCSHQRSRLHRSRSLAARYFE